MPSLRAALLGIPGPVRGSARSTIFAAGRTDMDTLWFNIVQWLHTAGLHIDGGTARAVGDAAATATAQLDMPSLLALAAALGWASGFRRTRWCSWWG